MNLCHLVIGALALGSGSAYSQNSESQVGKQNAYVQIRAGKIIDSTHSPGLPQGGDKIPTFNEDITKYMGRFRGQVQSELFITPDKGLIKSENIVGGRAFTLGDATGTIGIGKLANSTTSRAWGVNISIK